MRWEDERYVRLYTRDTITWLRLGWEGQAVLALLFRKVDRAGLLEIGDEDPVAALSVVTGIPEEVCAVAWKKLSTGKEPVVTLRDDPSRALLIVNFLPAQEAKQSDKARQQKHREMAAAHKLVTPRDDPSQGVTKRHAVSHAVTPSCAVPSLAVPSCAEEKQLPPEAGASQAMLTLPEAKASKHDLAGEQQVFDCWAHERRKREPKFTDDRRRKIRARMAEGFSADKLCEAIRQVANDPWEDRPKHDDLEILLRNGAQVEKFLAMTAKGSTGPPRNGASIPAATREAFLAAKSKAGGGL